MLFIEFKAKFLRDNTLVQQYSISTLLIHINRYYLNKSLPGYISRIANVEVLSD